MTKPAEGEEKPEYISIPSEWMPGTVTDRMVKDLLSNGKEPKATSQNEEIGEGITLRSGKFGPYWSRDQKNASVPSWASEEERHDPAFASKYLSLPRVLGQDSQGQEVFATVGKFGPYVGCNHQFRNLNKKDHDQELFTITLEQALSLLAEEKKPFGRGKKRAAASSASAASQVATIGLFEGNPVTIAHGRYGYYVKFGGENYALPNQYKRDEATAKSVPLDEVIAIIEKKRQKDKS